MSKKIAFLFPGQNSHFLGMGLDIADRFPKAREIFDQADRICGKDISRLCAEGPLEELTLTVNQQPAITTVNLACLAALNESGLEPSVSAGHSLGEYAALCAAGVLTVEDTLKVVNKRGELMHRESLSHPGVMAAILGMNIEEVSKIVGQVNDKGILAVANHNTAEQIVITGEKEALDSAIKLLQEKGAKAIPLKVSGAWHCDLMAGAVDEFRRFMDDIPFSDPQTEVLFNATADRENNTDSIKDIMARQLTSPVRWYDILVRMLNEGVDTFIEVGPKKVLTGLVKKSVPKGHEARLMNVEDLKSLDSVLEAIS